MKKKNPIALFIAWLGLAATPAPSALAADASSAAQPATQTTLVGIVTNSATGRPLAGASVEIQGTGRSATTDGEGEYRFSNLPPGTLNLAVSYTGLDPAVVSADVRSGSANRRDVGLTAEIYRMSKFVVASEREGNAEAITLQKLSVGVRNIVSTDAFGSLAGNPADLLMRMPGVEADSVGGDRRYIRIRGLNENLNTVTMDGNRVGSGGGNTSGTRSYEFAAVGADTIERVEVVKSPTPDMDADSIGGAVNMVSKSAFDGAPERRIRGSYGMIWRALNDRDHPRRTYSFSYSEVFHDKLGIAINYGNRQHSNLNDKGTQAFNSLANGVAGPAYNTTFATQDFRNIRTAWGGGLRVDYKLSENSRFFINSTMSKYLEVANHIYGTYSTPATIATFDANGNPNGTGAVRPGYTENVTEWASVNYLNAAGTLVAPSTVTASSRTEYRRDQQFNVQLTGIHKYDTLEINWDIYKSKAKAHYPGNKTFDIIARGFGLKIERKDEPYWPTVTQTGGPDVTDIRNYTSNLYSVSIRSGWDQFVGAAGSAKKTFNTVVPTYIKVGGRTREQQRRAVDNSFRTTYVGPDGVVGINRTTGINDDNLAQFQDRAYKNPKPDLIRYPTLPNTIIPGRDTAGSTYGTTGFNIETALRNTPQYFLEDVTFNTTQPLVSDTKFKERINAAYIMGGFDLGKLSVMGGLRVEETKVEAEGALQMITPEERARRAAYVGAVTPAETKRRIQAEYAQRATTKGDTRGVFPGLHFKYSPSRSLVTRLSYATNIGRPAIGQLIPRTTINLPTTEFALGSISTSNPNLRPQRADNFDLATEYYFEPAGLISVGFFLKEIKDFIYTRSDTVSAGADNGFDGNYVGYGLTTQRNGGYAKVKGLELNYFQQFTFLPGWWSGFAAFANYTRMKVEGNYSTGNAIALAPTSEVAGFNPETGNIGISYNRNRATIRVQFNHHGRYLTGFSQTQSSLVYRRARDVVDVKTQYQLTKNFDLYLDVVNVLNEAESASEFYRGRPQTLSKQTPQFFFGVNGRM